MDFIYKKKINKFIVIAVLFLSFGFAELLSARGTLSYISYTNPDMQQPAWLFNDITAFLFGAIIPMIFYEVITYFTARFVSKRLGGYTDDMKYALRFFYVAANIVIGCIKFIYYLSPVITVFGNVLISFAFTTVAFALFLLYSAKRYIPSFKWGAMLLTVGGAYIAVEGAIVVFSLISGVLL